ncbi:glycosyltransferase family 2 protein [Klenkia taihuensis]|uniref:Glycosyl transferase family 2 n=1 Tax=Klenkia taihuensis TaxID=1225127 RepID=A0A1I1MJE6_9ACTN|nr:glycosyltransferase [Klenkia taihuensis]GHE14316.1 hypothetical protein GCM10011381_40380 [Klenkia taihuensis]SFC85256.1 Glycosyl transferase family 2 [Klenkia taihuensis]
MTTPSVSVLVPTYNGERFIKAAVRSALAQSHRDLEVVVGDDASTDRTPEVLAELAAADDRVRVVRHPRNVGAFENPRLLLSVARGEYVKYLLHDDVLATDCVRDMVRAFEADPRISLAFSHRTVIGEDGRPLATGQPVALADRVTTFPGAELADRVLTTGANLLGELTTIMFRRQDVEPAGLWAVDGRRMTILGDVALCLDLLRRGDAWYSPRPLSRFRVHQQQRTWDTRLWAVGVADWPHLVDWAGRAGLLTGDGDLRRAFTVALLNVAARLRDSLDGGLHPVMLDAVELATRRLRELALDRDALDLPDPGPLHQQAVPDESVVAVAAGTR